jgi:hypothetical protein
VNLPQKTISIKRVEKVKRKTREICVERKSNLKISFFNLLGTLTFFKSQKYVIRVKKIGLKTFLNSYLDNFTDFLKLTNILKNAFE